MAAKQWYYREDNGTEFGPFTGADLRKLVQSGRVRRDTLVRSDSGGPPIAAGKVKGLVPETESGVRPATPNAATSQSGRSGGHAGLGPRAMSQKPPLNQPFEAVDDQGYAQPLRSKPNNVFAVTSLICGILGWTIVPVIGALVAIVTGHIALKQIERSSGREDGKIMAVIGLILGYVEAVLALVASIMFLIAMATGLSLFSFFLRQVDLDAQRKAQERPKIESPRDVDPSKTLVPNFREFQDRLNSQKDQAGEPGRLKDVP